MAKITYKIRFWFETFFRSCTRQFRMVLADAGVMLFFLALPLAYPVVYTLIYNPEVVREIPIAIVDNSRTAESRHLARMIDATENASVEDMPHHWPRLASGLWKEKYMPL